MERLFQVRFNQRAQPHLLDFMAFFFFFILQKTVCPKPNQFLPKTVQPAKHTRNCTNERQILDIVTCSGSALCKQYTYRSVCLPFHFSTPYVHANKTIANYWPRCWGAIIKSQSYRHAGALIVFVFKLQLNSSGCPK